MTDIAAHSETEIVEAVRAARAWKSPLNIVGARTKRNLGRATASWGTVLDLSALKGIVAYEPDELILTVLPGTPIADIEALLAEKNQRLGFNPADWSALLGGKAQSATIGGVIASDACGSAAVRFGRTRDSLLGFRAVNGWGEAYKAGGKVVKNVTGFDLSKLMCGAFGTLGPLTELTLRVFPKAARSATLAIRDLAPAEGLALLRRVWSSPLEATGLAYVPDGATGSFPDIADSGRGAAVFRLEGATQPLQEKAAALRALLAGKTLSELPDGDDVFTKIGNGIAFAGGETDIWRVCVPPADAARCAAEADAKAWLADWAGGVLWLATGASQPVDAIVSRPEGTATLMRASEERRGGAVFQPPQEGVLALIRSVKAAFDPLGLFNPGRMYEGI
ncbi:MAG TPA: FAD-binding protein [Rhizomicrobium sp.]|jgi:glycolate oxidase FAD binding subunit